MSPVSSTVTISCKVWMLILQKVKDQGESAMREMSRRVSNLEHKLPSNEVGHYHYGRLFFLCS